MTQLKTTRDVPSATRGGLKFTIPAGSPVERFDGRFIASPKAFPRNSIERHDATYYGVEVPADAVNLMEEFTDKLPESGPIGAYRVEVIADNSGVWAGNGLTFATQDEAVAYAKDLMMRWMLVREWRVNAA